MHRAEQIVDAVAAKITASTTFSGSVLTHLATSLSEVAAEMPAISVDVGADEPADEDGADNFSFLDSLLTVDTTAYVRGEDEAEIKSALLDARRSIHVALMADRSQGLAFVIDTRYGGAEAPEITADADRMAGRQVSRWSIQYRMNVSDPS